MARVLLAEPNLVMKVLRTKIKFEISTTNTHTLTHTKHSHMYAHESSLISSINIESRWLLYYPEFVRVRLVYSIVL